MRTAGRAVRRRTAPQLPAEPPTLHIPEAPFYPKFLAGDPRAITPTLMYLLREHHVRDGRQKLLCVGRQFFAWRDCEMAWRAVADEEVKASLYRSLRDNRWSATPKHVKDLWQMMRLALHYPPPLR